ncbi:ABC transporter substrate-binding protein [Anaeromicropila populeti]|uniref:Iron complex transport system substrate-binding protein n=1 Tax=Anaeromicropila populeti TaxID=37658 RepID=A0A1I6J0U7_9FIRM|nr:ABC transporter substrate-binding protein [Anaeromicropila populeti]SFR72558.1 iron complex transport system substrate-binding protein [Anaeromicropila populeti]
MKNYKKILPLLLVLVLTFGLTACGSKTNSSEEQDANPTVAAVTETENTEVSEATEAETPAPATEYPVTITDSEGRDITVEAEPEKVVSMAPNITELMFALGAEDKLVGRTDYCDYPEEAAQIESVGTLTTPDIEKIISLQPDVVIASTHFTEESEEKLTELGIKVILLYEEHEVEGVYTILDTLGTILNEKDSAAALVTEMKTSIEETKAAVAGLETPSVYYVVGFGEYGDYTAGGDTFVGQLITLAGGNNIAQDVSGWSYTLESLVEADPDIIIIAEGMKESFVTADNYKELSAVKNGNVYGIDNNTVERQGYRNAEGIRALAEIFHPDAFK